MGLVVIDHVILVKCTFHCLPVVQFARPGNWSEVQQHVAEHLCDVFKNDGLRDAFFVQAQVGGGSARAGPSSSETCGGRRKKRSRCRSAPGGRADYSISGQRGRTERADRHRVQDVLGSMLRESGRSNGRGRSALPRIRWYNQKQRADHQEQLGPPYVLV